MSDCFASCFRIIVTVAALFPLQVGLRSRRKPTGYWQALDNVDQEIAMFVAAGWIKMPDPDTDEQYWYNQVRLLARRYTLKQLVAHMP